MIKLEEYSENFLDTYWKIANKKIPGDVKKKIVESSKKFLPHDFYNNKEDFKTLVLAPFEKLKKAYDYIEKNTEKNMKSINCSNNFEYSNLVDGYNRIVSSQENRRTMRVRIVKNTGLTVCPYCNRDYINCRGDNVSGAQLDHFFNKTDYPIFSICIYNLIPVCGNCNRVKSKKNNDYISPFDNDANIDWVNGVTFSYEFLELDHVKLKIDHKLEFKNNIEDMNIAEAYEIHEREVLELIEKKAVYNKTQIQEIIDLLVDKKISESDIKATIFGPRISLELMKTKPLAKMFHDLHKQLHIYD